MARSRTSSLGNNRSCGPCVCRHWETDVQRLPGFLDMAMIIITTKGSVFPRALCFSLPCALLAVALKTSDEHHLLGSFAGLQILSNAAAYSGFSLVLGFLVVFRTNMAYNRYWEGFTAGQRMFAEWFDFASTTLAFTTTSKASPELTSNFVNQLVEYLSLLHGGAVSTLRGDEFLNQVALDGLEDESVFELEGAVFPVTVVFQWIQQLLVHNLDTGVLDIPAPIVSRAFQQFANGMVAYHDAHRVQTTAFPFPYVQMTTLLLIVHWCITPVVICMWTEWISWVFIFTLVQVFFFWCLYFTAFEIEFPFKKGHNTYAAEEAHAKFNLELRQLMLTKPAKLRVEANEGARFHIMSHADTTVVLDTLDNDHNTKSFGLKPQLKSFEQTRLSNARVRRERSVERRLSNTPSNVARSTSRKSSVASSVGVEAVPPQTYRHATSVASSVALSVFAAEQLINPTTDAEVKQVWPQFDAFQDGVAAGAAEGAGTTSSELLREGGVPDMLSARTTSSDLPDDHTLSARKHEVLQYAAGSARQTHPSSSSRGVSLAASTSGHPLRAGPDKSSTL